MHNIGTEANKAHFHFLFSFLQVAVATDRDGEKGESSIPAFSLLHFPSPEIPQTEIKSVSGAGDCLNAGFISGLLKGLNLEECGLGGTECAKHSLRSIYNVPPNFTSSPLPQVN